MSYRDEMRVLRWMLVVLAVCVAAMSAAPHVKIHQLENTPCE